jgi:hypothetical protein
MLEFGWLSDKPSKLKVLDVSERKFVEMEWLGGSIVKYSLDSDRPVEFTLEVKYPDSQKGKDAQILELPSWSFYLANLKSAIQGGPDLRNRDGSSLWKEGFVD